MNDMRSEKYTAVSGECGLPLRLQTVQFAKGNKFDIEPHETENL